jgi:hypothetical protein
MSDTTIVFDDDNIEVRAYRQPGGAIVVAINRKGTCELRVHISLDEGAGCEVLPLQQAKQRSSSIQPERRKGLLP